MEKIASMMAGLRLSGSPFDKTASVTDYSSPINAELGYITLPVSNVLKYKLDDCSWIAVCPSDIELKIKIYYSIKSADEATAEKKLEEIQNII